MHLPCSVVNYYEFDQWRDSNTTIYYYYYYLLLLLLLTVSFRTVMKLILMFFLASKSDSKALRSDLVTLLRTLASSTTYDSLGGPSFNTSNSDAIAGGISAVGWKLTANDRATEARPCWILDTHLFGWVLCDEDGNEQQDAAVLIGFTLNLGCWRRRVGGDTIASIEEDRGNELGVCGGMVFHGLPVLDLDFDLSG